MKRQVFATITMFIITVIAFQLGRKSQQDPCKYMNDLIEVGFKMIDPEGSEIDHWDTN